MKVLAAAHGAHKAQRHSSSFDFDAVHRGAWRLPATARPSALGGGWADPGERVALKYVSVEARHRPILDLGVGAGRTTNLLRAISRDYIGIDDNPQMVDLCRDRHPDAQISRMDPRSLGRFDDNQFALVQFSFNGIDAFSLSDRRRVLREVVRVLQPNGLFLFSAHNRDAAAQPAPELEARWTETPSQPAPRGWHRVRSLLDSVRHCLPGRFHRPPDEWEDIRWASHRFGTLGTYATLADQKRQLREAGLQAELVLDNVAGRPVADDADTTGFAWFHYVARKV